MITILEKILIKNEYDDNKRRNIYGAMCGFLGIFLNVVLFAVKFAAGTVSRSISITADAFNNLSDAGSSIISLIGFRLAGKKPDPEHPFGHGRMEYVSGLIISFVILIMAYELIRSSIAKIIHPEETEFSITIIVILVISILVKLYISFYNYRIGKKINSTAMRATAFDSISDMVSTFVVLLGLVISHYANVNIDGYCGVIVSLFIFYVGFSSIKDTISPLLGQAPSKEYVDDIYSIVMCDERILGIHDIIVHDYGPGRKIVSLHAEVPSTCSITEIHDLIDGIEHRLADELNCDATIHMDPVETGADIEHDNTNS